MGAAASIVVERGLKIGGPSPGREKQYRKTLVTNSDQKNGRVATIANLAVHICASSES
jgi:hypothetical protein